MLQQQQQEQYFDTSLPVNIITSSSSSNESIVSNFIYTSLPSSSSLSTYQLSPEISHQQQLDMLPKNDFSQLIDLDNFQFIMNPKNCRDLDQQPLVVILVHSAPDNIHKRQTIRETWGQNDSRSILLFLIGDVNATTLEEKITLENDVNGDIVQGNFHDAYRNMTYKHVMALKWFVYNCPNARYLLKTDDDVFINTPKMYSIIGNAISSISVLPYQEIFSRGRLIYCHAIERAKVKRTYRSKWHVTFKEYPDKYFPRHCPGFAILYSSKAVYQLYREAQQLPYFWIDDVHITGTVATKLNISITSFDKLYLESSQQDDLLSGRSTSDDIPFFFARPNLGESQIRKLWKSVRKPKIATTMTTSTISISAVVTSARHKNANDNEVVGNDYHKTVANDSH